MPLLKWWWWWWLWPRIPSRACCLLFAVAALVGVGGRLVRFHGRHSPVLNDLSASLLPHAPGFSFYMSRAHPSATDTAHDPGTTASTTIQ